MNSFKTSWTDWIKLQRSIPILTAATAFVTITAANLGLFKMPFHSQVILTILGLLAIDALVERKRILEQMRHSLDILSGGGELHPSLMWEKDALQRSPLDEYMQGANEVFVSGGSLTDLLSRQREVIQTWLSQTKDARLLLILENPVTARKGKTPVWSSDIDREIYATDIETSLKVITNLKKEFRGRIEVRLTDQVPSLTTLIVDRTKARISLNLYMGGPEERPVFELAKTTHSKWLELFEKRYRNQLWKQSIPWPPA